LDTHYFTGGQGKPLLIIHGGGEGAESWLNTAIQLAEHYTVYIPDLPGFGKSKSSNDQFDIAQYISFIEDFAKEIDLEQFYIMGHSVGGSLALHYALEYPHRIQKLIALNSFGLGKEIALWLRITSNPFVIEVFGGIATYIIKALKAISNRIRPHIQFKDPLPKIKMDIGRKTATFSGQTNVITERFKELLMPVLLIAGKKDYIVPYAQVYSAGKLIPECRVRVFQNCSHTIRGKMVPVLIHEVTDFIGMENRVNGY
jgi:4,5:9,10-diseco-3-hydroxy-5,9,17-trioxoandrosta-1(10),2-diene-4-oate hydrolase